MNDIVSKLLMYGDMDESEILMQLAKIYKDYKVLKEECDIKGVSSCKNEISNLRTSVYREIKRLLVLATDYGFDDNLWHNYLTFILMTNENPFSLTSEKVGANVGSVNSIAKSDFQTFIELFNFDFKPLEEFLDIDSFTFISDYTAVRKKELMYNLNVSEKVRALSKKLAAAKDVDAFFIAVTDFYRDYGVGMFGLNKAFRIEEKLGGIEFVAINNMDKVMLSDLIGYEIQKKKLTDNTLAFVSGKKANNVLLFGDSGTGKSTAIKAIVNEFYDKGLRMIEIYKHQFKDLSKIIAAVKNRNYKFIIYMDDLSFEEFEVEYKFLKAVIEGGVETKPENILIYATSNRRHIVKETWSDRDDVQVDNGIHKSDTMEEKLSLVNRFGVTISYSKPTPKEFYDIVIGLARRAGITNDKMDDDTLKAEANKWELSHGGLSGRTATQFVNYLLGMMDL